MLGIGRFLPGYIMSQGVIFGQWLLQVRVWCCTLTVSYELYVYAAKCACACGRYKSCLLTVKFESITVSGAARIIDVSVHCTEDPVQVVLAGSQSLLGHMPEYILDLVMPVAKIPGRSALCTSSRGNLVVLRTRRRIGDRAFSVAAPLAWNRLPTELKLLRSTDSFRRDLKTFLFNSVYGHQDTDSLCDAPSVF